MKKKAFYFLLFVVGFLLQSCAPPPSQMGYEYDFKFKMLNSSRGDSSLYFIDSNIEAVFDIQRDRISFVIYNLSKDALKVNWDDAAIVFNGEAMKIVHARVTYEDRTRSMPMSVIPPLAKIDDFVVPSQNLYISQLTYKLSTYSLFIFDDVYFEKSKKMAKYITGQKGIRFSLYLPLLKKSEVIDYNYEFMISDIIKTPRPGQKMVNEKAKKGKI